MSSGMPSLSVSNDSKLTVSCNKPNAPSFMADTITSPFDNAVTSPLSETVAMAEFEMV